MAKVLVSLDANLVRRLDEEAAARGVSRSALIAELAEQGLGTQRGPGAAPEVQKAVAELEDLFRESPTPGPDSTRIIREMRDAR
jgi:metal-responsive CopG/Arc/MetJ family transcriptional regulator